MNIISKDDRIIAASIYAVSYFTAFIGPIIIWLIKKDESDFIDYHGRQYFNFLVSYIIYYIIAGILLIILVGAVLIWVLGILQLIFTIVAAIRAFEGKYYKVPYTFSFFN